ncbi:MAG TPA: 30S ribosome-binding factor RbfA [Dehalococcoidia bacterium]|nr:30S ribosome-binding factor RbfA [Dehalococcoidia bacterium]
MSRRTERVNDLIRDELSELLLRELNDPRLGGLISITHVDVSPDLMTARVFVSVMAPPEEQKQAMKALEAAGGFMHRELKKRLTMRKVPFLSFKLDTSIAEGAEVLSLLDKVQEQDRARGQS